MQQQVSNVFSSSKMGMERPDLSGSGGIFMGCPDSMVAESLLIPVYIKPQDESNTSKTFDREESRERQLMLAVRLTLPDSKVKMN